MKKKLGAVLLVVALALSLGLVPAASVGANPDPGIVGLWHLDEGMGTTASDSSGTIPPNDGTIYGATWTTEGMFGNALSFDGSNDYVQVPDSATLRLTSNMTVEAWVYISALASDWVRVVGKGDSTYRNYGLWYHGPSGKVLFQIYDGTGLKANAGTTWGTVVNALTVSTEAWYHFAGVKEGSTVYLYLDSVLVASAPITFTPATSSDPLRLGYAGFHSCHNGTIDEVRIWDEALTADQIIDSANCGIVIQKEMSQGDAELGDTVTITLEVVAATAPTVVDTLPSELRYIPGTFKVDGVSATPSVVGQVISYTLPSPCAYTITFDAQVVSAEADDNLVTNTAVAGDAEAEAELTIHPYEGFTKEIDRAWKVHDTTEYPLPDATVVPIGTDVHWIVDIEVTNIPGDSVTTMQDVVVKDRLGGDLELHGAAASTGNATNYTTGKTEKVHLTWDLEGNLAGEESAWLALNISTDINPGTGNGKKPGHQEYTSPGWHELNSGAVVKFIDVDGTGFQLSAHTCPLAVYVPDAMLTLEDKSPDTWETIPGDKYGELYYNTSGDEFYFVFQGYGLENIEYSLIYYADKLDRFLPGNWGGDNPGALIGTGTASGGNLTMSGSVELNMDLPHPDDANSYYYNYADPGDPHYTGDGYATAYGAKIWLVPSSAYDAGNTKVTAWQPTRFLFETDLIWYDDTDV